MRNPTLAGPDGPANLLAAVQVAAAPEAAGLGTLVVFKLASRTGGGEVLQETYSFPGSERDLLSRGLIPAGVLDGLKARILLSLLLTAGANLDRVRTAFEQVNASISAPIVGGAHPTGATA